MVGTIQRARRYEKLSNGLLVPLVRRPFQLADQYPAPGGNLSPFPSSIPMAYGGDNLDAGGSGLILGLTITPQRAGITITGLRFRTDASHGQAPHLTPYLWDTGDSQLLTGTQVVAPSGGLWQDLPFTGSLGLTSGVTYKVGVMITEGNQTYTALAGQFVSAVDTVDFEAPANASFYNYITTGTGPFTPSSGGGTKGNSTAWYGVDVVYTG